MIPNPRQETASIRDRGTSRPYLCTQPKYSVVVRWLAKFTQSLIWLDKPPIRNWFALPSAGLVLINRHPVGNPRWPVASRARRPIPHYSHFGSIWLLP